MKYVNALVFVGLTVSGLTLFVGVVAQNGSIEAIAAYFGWFLAAYSGVAYLIVSIVLMTKADRKFWSTFYPVNFGLALLGVSVLGIHDRRAVIYMALTMVLSVASAVAVSRMRLLERRFVPSALLLVLSTVLLEPVFTIGTYIAAFVGTTLLVGAFLALRQHPQ